MIVTEYKLIAAFGILCPIKKTTSNIVCLFFGVFGVVVIISNIHYNTGSLW